MRQHRTFLLIAPFFLACAAPAQQRAALEGTVLDPAGRPVPNATVRCSDQQMRTGPDGRFMFSGVDRCQASVSAAGFKPEEFELAGGRSALVNLAIATVAESVVVSATRMPANVEESGVSASILTRDELAARQFPDLADALREVPGVQIARYGTPGSLTQLFTRGSERTGTLVLLDGVPVNDPGGELNLAGLTTAPLERIEVVRGPESALFGAEAAAGVIQLFTKRGDPEARIPHGSVSYDRGSFKSDRWIANVGGGSGERFDYAVSAEQFHTAGEFTNNYFRNTSGTANLGYRFSERTQLRGILHSYDSIVGTPNQIGYGIIDRDANEASRDYTAGLRLEDVRGSRYTQSVSFGYHRLRDVFLDPGPDGPFALAALVRDVPGAVPRTYLDRFVFPSFPASLVPAGLRLITANVDYLMYPSDPYINRTERQTAGYQGALSHSGGAAVFGYDFDRESGNISGHDVDRRNHGLFVHEQHTVGGRLFLSGGVRVERNSVFGTKLTPRGAASIKLAGEHGVLSSTFLRFSAGRGITEPTLVQNFSRESYAVGNPNLRPEKTTSFEVGLVQEWFSRRLRTEVSTFDNYFRDLIVYMFPTWQNIAASRARGVEFSAQARLASFVSLNGTYTHMHSRITSSSSPTSSFTGVGQELARRPGNSGAVSLSLTPRRFWFQTGAVFVGERQDPDTLLGVNRNPAYQSVYAAASVPFRHVVPFVRVENLMNSRYQEVLGYPALGRSVSAGSRVEW